MAIDNEVDQFEQDAFGNLVSGNWVTRVGHITEQITTKQYDVDLGLYYFSARWYDPLSGRFMEYDKAATVRLVPQGAALYSLAYSLPTKLVDPSGYGASDPPLDFTGCVTAMVHILDAVEGRAAQTCTGRYAQAWDRCEPFFNRHFVKGGDADGTTDLGCKCTDACGAMATISKVHCIRCCVMRHSDICRRALLLHDQGILKKWQDFQAALEIESGLVDCFILGGPVKDLIEAALDECLENLFGNLYKYLQTCTVDGEPYFPEHRERGR